MKEIVGNLVVTDLQKYLEKSPTTSIENLMDSNETSSKAMPYNFHRVRRSIIDAYEGDFNVKIINYFF